MTLKSTYNPQINRQRTTTDTSFAQEWCLHFFPHTSRSTKAQQRRRSLTTASLLAVKRNFWLQPTRWTDMRFWYLRCNLALPLRIHTNVLGGSQNHTLIHLQLTLNVTLDHFFHLIDVGHVNHTSTPPKVVKRVCATCGWQNIRTLFKLMKNFHEKPCYHLPKPIILHYPQPDLQ